MTLLLFSLSNVVTIVWTILGIGLVIFVHELGHFLCAKKIGVEVEVFSLGFGPRLFGFEKNGTDYRISAVPVGGYVKVAGDQPGEDERSQNDLSSRSVGQRFLFYSGGVIMNVLFAIVVFPIIFSVGVPMVQPGVGAVKPGGPAWKAGLREGDEILQVNGRDVLGFTDIVLEVALGDPDHLDMRIRRDGSELTLAMEPEYNEDQGTYAIGISQPTNYVARVHSEGAASRAGMMTGDQIIAINGESISGRRLSLVNSSRGIPAIFSVMREAVGVIDVEVTPDQNEEADQKVIGIRTVENLVIALRGDFTRPGGALQVGDRLLSVNEEITYDPDDVARAVGSLESDGVYSLLIERRGAQKSIDIPGELGIRLATDVAFSWKSPDSPAPNTDVPVRVMSGGPAELAGLRTGMSITGVEGQAVNSWSDLRTVIRESSKDTLAITAASGDSEGEFHISLAPDVRSDFGFDIETARVVRRYDLGEAFLMGLRSSWNLTRQAYVTLRKMFARQVSAENMGGIVAISHVSYRFAEQGLPKLFYFLALLSLNLAVINLLPIPVLDGGHLLFLLIEKIKGSPVNDRVMGYSQVVGLVVILSLLIFVTYNDIRRLVD